MDYQYQKQQINKWTTSTRNSKLTNGLTVLQIVNSQKIIVCGKQIRNLTNFTMNSKFTNGLIVPRTAD